MKKPKKYSFSWSSLVTSFHKHRVPFLAPQPSLPIYFTKQSNLHILKASVSSSGSFVFALMEYEKLVEELSEGIEKANQLRRHIGVMYPNEMEELLLQKILSSFKNALLILNRAGSVIVNQPTSGSVDCSVHAKNVRDGDPIKKRKLERTWTEQVRVEPGNRIEGPAEDGYSWRKYGQKHILGAKYPRSYYRCTFRHAQNCSATKQVQRSNDERTVFDVKYKGTHSCKEVMPNSVPEPQQGMQKNDILDNMKANLKVDTKCSNMEEETHKLFTKFVCNEAEYHYSSLSGLVDDRGSYSSPAVLIDDTGMSSYSSPLFDWPAISRENYFNEASYQMKNYMTMPMHSETHVPDRGSAHASTTNSSNGGMGFSNDEFGMNPSFLIDNTDFVFE